MKILQYSIYDYVMEIYNQPFVAFNDNDAIRTIQQAGKPDTTLWMHSQDFALHLVAEYDNETGSYENVIPPKLIARVSLILTQQKDEYAKSIENQRNQGADNDSQLL